MKLKKQSDRQRGQEENGDKAIGKEDKKKME